MIACEFSALGFHLNAPKRLAEKLLGKRRERSQMRFVLTEVPHDACYVALLGEADDDALTLEPASAWRPVDHGFPFATARLLAASATAREL